MLPVLGGLLRGRTGDLFDSAESGEGPCALVRAQERMRSGYEGESGEVFFIDIEKKGSGGLVCEA